MGAKANSKSAMTKDRRWTQRWLGTRAALVILFLIFFTVSVHAFAAVIPAGRSRSFSSGEITSTSSTPLYRDDDGFHRQLLLKRHAEISSGSVPAGFVHPTHLYRRVADALPAPNKAYNMTVTQDTINPDGYPRLGFLMNGKFPADPFVWDENDDVEITVNNQSPVPFAIHWHGLHQIGTPEMDGVPGLSQWNIYTGQSYTYRFKLINQHGGYWYHSHERGYYADGLRGTIYIRPKADRKKPWSLISSNQTDIDQMEAAEKDFQVMQLSDHWHVNHTEMLLIVHETGVPPACFDSLQINGRGRQYCLDDWSIVSSYLGDNLLKAFATINPEGFTSKGCISLVPPKTGYTVKDTLDGRYGGVCKNTTAPLTVFSATKAIKAGRKWLNFQIIDTATNWYYGVSIDSHKMWIVAVDGHYIEPMQVDWAQITIGSRLSVMVELKEEYEGNMFPIRLTGARPLQPIEGHAFLSYVDEMDGTWSPSLEQDFDYALRELTTAHVPFSGITTTNSDAVKWQANLSLPFDPISKVPKLSNMTLHAVASQNSLNVWQLASVPLDTAHLADERPMLFNATDGSATSNQMTPYATIPMGTVVDIIMENNIYSIVGGPNSPHPFHMHSRRFWIIGSGSGPFPADSVIQAQAQGVVFDLDNPPLRDGFDIDANSWVVIRYVVDHAAANILHCHIDDHAIEGMAAVLLEGLEAIPAGGNFSDTIKNRPTNWVETSNDELGKVLEAAWTTGAVESKWIEPAAAETSTPWGDPRSLAQSIQLFVSSNSVQRSITSSLLSELSLLQASETDVTAITATVSDQVTVFTGVATATTTAAAAATSTTSQTAINAAASAPTTVFATRTVTVTYAGESTHIATVSPPTITSSPVRTTNAASSDTDDSSSRETTLRDDASSTRATATETSTDSTATGLPDSTGNESVDETTILPISDIATSRSDSTLLDEARETDTESTTRETTQLAISVHRSVTTQVALTVSLQGPATTAVPLTTFPPAPATSVATLPAPAVSVPAAATPVTAAASLPIPLPGSTSSSDTVPAPTPAPTPAATNVSPLAPAPVPASSSALAPDPAAPSESISDILPTPAAAVPETTIGVLPASVSTVPLPASQPGVVVPASASVPATVVTETVIHTIGSVAANTVVTPLAAGVIVSARVTAQTSKITAPTPAPSTVVEDQEEEYETYLAE